MRCQFERCLFAVHIDPDSIFQCRFFNEYDIVHMLEQFSEPVRLIRIVVRKTDDAVRIVLHEVLIVLIKTVNTVVRFSDQDSVAVCNRVFVDERKSSEANRWRLRIDRAIIQALCRFFDNCRCLFAYPDVARAGTENFPDQRL